MRRFAWIVWIVVALLPLRGWAFAAMPMAGPAHASSVFATHASQHGPQGSPIQQAIASAMPCHGAPGHAIPQDASARGGMSHGDAGRADASHDGTDPTCALCQICHGAFAAAPAVPAFEPPLAHRAAAPAHDTPAPDAERRGLFRPPRA